LAAPVRPPRLARPAPSPAPAGWPEPDIWSKLRVDRSSSAPLYRQLAGRLEEAIAGGGLADGVKLPSSRDVARQLGLQRKIVVRAYRLLQDEGWVTAGVGQGTFVSHADSRSRAVGNGHDWTRALRRSARPRPWMNATVAGPGDLIRFTGATADPSTFPADAFRDVLDEVFRTMGASALEYGPTEGVADLRGWVAERLRARGSELNADQVIIVSGSQQGLDLISRLLVAPGDNVLVEEPGYASGFRLFHANGASVHGVPVDEDGLRFDVLADAASRHSPRFLYLMPNFQNPTGISLREARRVELMDLCDRAGLPVVEDQFDSDLYYEGAPPRPLQAMDRGQRVVLLGSFSKILFPGLRLGWLVVPPALVQPVRELKQMADFGSSLLAQHAMVLYCRRGLLERHLEGVRQVYGGRLRAMLDAMDRWFPPEVSWTRPKGGLTLWCTLPPRLSAADLLPRAREAGIDFSPGSLFHPSGGGGNTLRLSYIREPEERIRRGIEIFGALLKSALEREPAGSSGGPMI